MGLGGSGLSVGVLARRHTVLAVQRQRVRPDRVRPRRRALMEAFGWRFVYWFAGTRAAVALVATGFAVATRLVGEMRAEGLLSVFERRFVISGWPHHGRGWVNLHMSRFMWRVRRFSARRPPIHVKPVAAGRRRIRVGCVGRFRGLLSFPKALFDAFPREAELHLFDLEYGGRCA